MKSRHYSISISTGAEQDMTQIFDWYESKQIGLGNEFLTELKSTLDLLKKTPFGFLLYHKLKRQIKMKRFPYFVIYEVMESKITVLAVFHTSKNPEGKFN